MQWSVCKDYLGRVFIFNSTYNTYFYYTILISGGHWVHCKKGFVAVKRFCCFPKHLKTRWFLTENCHFQRSRQTITIASILFILHGWVIHISSALSVLYKKIHVSTRTQHAVSMETILPIAQYIYCEWDEFLPKN